MIHLGKEEFEKLVAKAIDRLPPQFAELLDNIFIVVEDSPSRDVLDELELDDPYDLLGLYQGVPLDERGFEYSELPDQVILYRLAILSVCDSLEAIVEEVRDTLVHELGHHFGLDDEEMPY